METLPEGTGRKPWPRRPYAQLAARFARPVIWVPGNHELWYEWPPFRAESGRPALARLTRSYRALSLEIARSAGIVRRTTPGPVWGGRAAVGLIATLFLLL